MGAGQGREEYFRRFIPETVNDDHVAFDNEIIRSIVGSTLFGTSLDDGQSDIDEMGVFIEPAEFVLGFKKMEHFTWRNEPEGVKSKPGDRDLTLYSLRKYISLAMQGNPTSLVLLYAPDDMLTHQSVVGMELQALWKDIASRRAIPRFLGYLEAQRQRLKGEKKGHVPSRPELIDKYGYDTKYAMHALRLGLQGIEYVKTGRITLPAPSHHKFYLRGVRKGVFTYEEVLEEIDSIEDELKVEAAESSLPDEPNKDKIEQWLIIKHLEQWEQARSQ